MLRRVLIIVAAGKGLACVGFVVAACSSTTAAPVTPAPSSGVVEVSSTPPFAPILERAWFDGRHMCGEQTMLVVDHLAAVLMTELDAPMLDARLEAARYVRDRCA